MITNPWIEQGQNIGAISASQKILIDQMELKFGALPEPIVERIQSTNEIDELNTFLRRIITANRLEEMQISNGAGTSLE
jgi:transposase-like protein